MLSNRRLDVLWKAKPKVSLRKLNRDTVLIEGNSAGLEFLGLLLTSQAEDTDCGVQFLNNGAGGNLFSKNSLWFYIHRVPCNDHSFKKAKKKERQIAALDGTLD